MDLADSIKRLRELDAKRAAGNWYAHDSNQRLNACVVNDNKEGWSRVESDYTLIDADESPNLEPDDIAFIAAAPEAIKTINQLVELVAEMRVALIDANKYVIENELIIESVSKADALLNKLGEV